MNTFFAAATLFAAALSALIAALAALPTGSLSFVTPTATVGPNDIIDVAVRLTLSAASSPLVFSSNPLTGFAAADLPKQGTYFDPVTGMSSERDFAVIDSAGFGLSVTCSGNTFVSEPANVCGPSMNYGFDFWNNANNDPARPSLLARNSFNLGPGQSYDFVLGQYLPAAAGAAPGTYSFSGMGVTLYFQGQDADGNGLFSNGFDIAVACTAFSDPACTTIFTRTVLAVPEPGTYTMTALGFLAVGGLAGRARQRG